MNCNNLICRFIVLLLFGLLGGEHSFAGMMAGLSLRDSLFQLNSIPLLDIRTVNGEEPTCDYIDRTQRPPGTIGEGITNCTKAPGRCTMYSKGKVVYDSGDYEPGESGLTIKIRGNTSALYSEKKPYKLKLQKKADLLLRDDKDCKIKDWVLLKGETLNEIISWKLNNLLDYSWVPHAMYVNLFINDDYRGLYLLCEPIKRGQSLIDVNKEDGYVMEFDPYWWNEDLYVPSTFDYKFQYTFKYPEAEDLTEEQLSYISNYCEKMEKTFVEGGYEQFIDVRSFALWFLGHDILGSGDSAGTNKFLVKKSREDIFYMGPLWDFDAIEYEEGKWAKTHYLYPFGTILFSSIDNTFIREYINNWNSYKLLLENGMKDYLDELNGKTEWIDNLNTSRTKNAARWHYDNESVEDEITRHQKWFTERFNWLEDEIQNIPISTGFNQSILHSSSSQNHYMFDMSGRQIKIPDKVFIKNKRKYINKK